MNLRNLRPLLLSAALLGLTAAAALADNTFDRTLNVSSSPDLYVSTGSGNIRITPGSGNQIHVVGHIHAGWSAFGDVDGRITRIVQNPPIVQSGNTVRIGAESGGLFNNISIDYDISVPADVALNLHSGSGDVEVNHVGRFLSATSGSGNVRGHGIHGAADLQSGSGDIELEEEGPGDVKARTGSGGIQIHGLNGAFAARTGSGDITADGHLQGADVKLEGSTLHASGGGATVTLAGTADINGSAVNLNG